MKYQDADSMALPGNTGPEAQIMAKEEKKKNVTMHIVGTIVIIALLICVAMYFIG